MAYQKELTLTKEQAEEFYKEHEGKDFYDSLTTHMSRSGVCKSPRVARELFFPTQWPNVGTLLGKGGRHCRVEETAH